MLNTICLASDARYSIGTIYGLKCLLLSLNDQVGI
jgi:hypothetical protein